ncbi:hypothetical protein C8Q76DRAFT_790139 [Earliella scabrosa]|nr:hypothetical protein C8Q76DRAFT_790139 [Earliella scabrosa]
MDPPQVGELCLASFLAEHYRVIKSRFPGEGRRKWRLRVAELFWALSPEHKAAYLTAISQNAPEAESIEEADFTTDEDPLDEISDDAPGIGLLVRADYTNEDAWQAFSTRLQAAEAEFAAEMAARDADDDASMGNDAEFEEGREAQAPPSAAQGAAPPHPSSSSTDARGDSAMDTDPDGGGAGSDEDDEDDDRDARAPGGASPSPAAVFFVVNAPAGDPLRAALAGISNIGALRLLNDVDVRRAPAPPRGTKRLRPGNRLVDHDGWQEAYAGRTVWVYDARSNVDQCVRLVSQRGAAMYGTATGDSWRARVSHICELQVNLASGAMTIDFGGLDRWDYAERARNMEEAVRPVT